MLFLCLVEVINILGSRFKIALFNETRLMYQAVPGWASLIIFLVVLFLLGVMEGIQVKTMALASKQQVAQIALVELKRQDPATYRESHPQAYRYNQFSHPVRVFPMNQYRVQARTDCRQGRQH